MSREDFFRKELVEELRFAEGLMKTDDNPERKIYYFSAAYGITSRTYRYSFSKDVLLADFVLNASYNILKERLAMIKAGDPSVELDEKVFDQICKGLRQLADAFENKENIQDDLETIITAAFSTTGPGRYLHVEKGSLSLE